MNQNRYFATRIPKIALTNTPDVAEGRILHGMETLLHARKYQDVVKLFESLYARGTHCSLAAGLAMRAMNDGKNSKQCLALLDRLLQDRFQHLEKIHFDCAVTAAAKTYNVDRVLKLLDSMVDRGWATTRNFNVAMTACAGRGHIEKALNLLNTMVQKQQQRQQQQRLHQQNSIRKERTAVRGESVPVPDQYSYTIAINACARGGQIQLVPMLLEQMIANGVQPDESAFNFAIQACAQGGHLDQALTTLNRMSECKGVKPSTVSFNSALSACVIARQAEPALMLLEKMRAADVTPDVQSIAFAIEACGRDGRLTKAMHLLDTVGPSVVAFNSAIAACGEAGQPDDAMKLFERISEVGLTANLTSYNNIIAAVAKAGQIERGLLVLDKMRDARVPADLMTLLPMVQACERATDVEHALILFERALALHVKLDVAFFRRIVDACARSGQHNRAEPLLKKITPMDSRLNSSMAY